MSVSGSSVASEEESLALPETVIVTRRSFEVHVRGHAFKSWEEFVRAQPGGMAPQGASLTSVKCDPMQVFAWVATALIQICIWGLVGYFASQNLLVGIALTAAYGIGLWFFINTVPPQMAGMLWPNLPTIVGAVGLQTMMLFGGFNFDSEGPSHIELAKILFGVIVPATAAAAVFMSKLPEDPDRAVLVCNLFLGLWAGNITLVGMLAPEDAFTFMYYWASCSLLALGVAAILVAVRLHDSPGRWGSVELVTWTMNVGATAMCFGTLYAVVGPLTNWDFELIILWVPISGVSALLAALGLRFNRTFPVLLSALGLFSVCVRLSVAVYSWTGGNVIAAFCTFGGLGVVIVLAAQYLLQSDRPDRTRENVF